jgi:signal transduction histidine kinase
VRLSLRSVAEWLRRVPIDDALDRRNAPVVQLLLICIGGELLVNTPWVYLNQGLYKQIPLFAIVVDLSTDVFVLACIAFSLYWIRHGRFRLAVSAYIWVSLLSLALTYAAFGITRLSYDDLYPLLMIGLAGLVLGRRMLWAVFLALVMVNACGALTDILYAAARQAKTSDTLLLLTNKSLGYLVTTVLLDRTVAALRETFAESKEHACQLVQTNALLEHEMVERERVQDQLVHAQKMEVVGRIASGVAHDFNNVLNVVLGYAMRRERLADQGTHALLGALEGVELASRRALAISRKLLNFSRQDVARPEVFDAGEVLREMQPMLRQLFDSNTRFQMDIDQIRLPVCLDRGQFELMMLNIAANARDAMPEGGHFKVIAQPAFGAGELEVTLADSGQGMPESVQKHVFEPFYTTKPLGQGTGLGLAVVQDMLKTAGGSISVRSSLGQGTTFQIRLPLLQA